MIRGGISLGCFVLSVSAGVADPPVVAPKPQATPTKAASPVTDCDACRFLSLPPRSGPIVPVENGPDLPPLDATPEPLPPADDASPLPAADEHLELRTLIEQALPTATADERRVWLEELRTLPLQTARDILSARTPGLAPTPLLEPTPADALPEPPLQSEPIDPGTLAPLRIARRRSNAAPQAHTTTLSILRQTEAVLLHNIANAGTAGFKRLHPSTTEAAGTEGLTGFTARRTATQGVLEKTGRLFDVAIDGDGFLQVRRGDTVALTRGGSLAVTESGEIAVIIDGQPWTLHPPVRIADETERLVMTENGAIGSLLPGTTFVPVGQIQLARVLDPSQLEPAGGGLLAVPESAGPAAVGLPDSDGFGAIRQGFLEGSNVDLDEELRVLQRVRTQITAFDETTSMPLLAAPAIDEPSR